MGTAVTGAAAATIGVGTAAAATPEQGSAPTPALASTSTNRHTLQRAVQPFPLDVVTLLDSAFQGNQSRNTAYLSFVDLDRLLHTFRLNVGLPSDAEPCGGWESPETELRGHSTGHLLSGLALTYANTGEVSLRDKGSALVAGLAECQTASPAVGYAQGYLSAFPEDFFDRLEAGTGVWAPYYTIHKIMAGLLEQYRSAGNEQALEVLLAQAAWVDERTGALGEPQMQQVLQTEFGGMNEMLADLNLATGDARWLDVAERFTHHVIFDPLAANLDQLAGLHANTQIPKMVGAQRLYEEGRGARYRTIARNFWRIVTDDHSYVIGGNSNGEVFHEPGAIASQLSNSCCENCNSYNMLKLTRLLHFDQPDRVELLDYYERTLFNQMLGEQDPDSEHGFNLYYTGLAPASYKQQPEFMGEDPEAYSTDYDNFSCDHGSGMETQAKFADTIYSHHADALYVNLFIPSEVRWQDKGITWRQTTGFPDTPSSTLTVQTGSAAHALRIRIPSWTSGARVTVNGGEPRTPEPGSWAIIERDWQPGDTVEVSVPMSIRLEPTPDDPAVRAVLYGPVVLAGQYGDSSDFPMPQLDPDSVEKQGDDSSPLEFVATANGEQVTLLPIARTHHVHYTAYWLV